MTDAKTLKLKKMSATLLSSMIAIWQWMNDLLPLLQLLQVTDRICNDLISVYTVSNVVGFH